MGLSEAGGDPVVADIDRIGLATALVRDADELDERAGQLCLPPERLAALRTAFVAGGLAALREASHPGDWIQADLMFDAAGEELPRLLRGQLADEIAGWLADGVASGFFFMQKPPGLRLRLQVGSRPGLHAASNEMLARLRRDGAIMGWRPGIYAPEVHLFGGYVGLGLAHRFFTADAMAILRYQREWLNGRCTLQPAEFSLLLLHACLARLVPSSWEQWDVWCRLRWAGRVPNADVAVPPEAIAWVRRLRAPGNNLMASADPSLRPVMRAYLEAMGGLAAAMDRAIEQARLEEHPRRFLPFWIVFHWNRMGFGLPVQGGLTSLMIAVLDPRGPPADE